MEKAIVKAFAGILVGVSIILFILWRLVNYTWDKRPGNCTPENSAQAERKRSCTRLSAAAGT
jgi:hypothetical protein